MSFNASTSDLRGVLQERFNRLLEEIEPVVRDQAESLAAEARQQARGEVGDRLNQAVRRIRQASGPADVFIALLDAAGGFSEGAAVLRVSGAHAAGVRIRGVDAAAAERFPALEIPLKDAPALAGAVDTRDPVVAMCSPAEVSKELAALAPQPDGGRVAIFPVVSGDVVAALLYCWGPVQSGPLELLAQVAGMALPVEKPGAVTPPPAPGLVAIAPAPQPKPPWEDLGPEEQHVHLKAQRYARVRVAEMRLLSAEAVQAGRIHRDLYNTLRDEIDGARDHFRASFITAGPSMVDYLHFELVRTLANDNAALLGSDYPGPLV